MDSFAILCREFSHLPTKIQNEEIGNLFIFVGGIRISRNPDETEEEFRNRTFAKGLKNLPDDSEYEGEFFENRIIPSLIEDFKDSSVETQERLMYKLSELTEGLSITRKSGESESRYRNRFYSRLLHKLPAGSEYEMVEFARQIDESDEDEYDEDESNEDDSDEDEYDESSSTRSDRGYSRGRQVQSKSYSRKGYGRRRNESDSEGGRSRSVSADENGGDTEPVEEGRWNDGSKKAGFNSKLKLKAKSKPNPATSRSKPNYSRPPISY